MPPKSSQSGNRSARSSVSSNPFAEKSQYSVLQSNDHDDDNDDNDSKRADSAAVTRSQQRAHASNGNGNSNGPPRTPSAPSLFSPNPQRARAEQLTLVWSVVWIGIMATIVYSRAFEHFGPNEYMAVGLVFFLVPVLTPLLVPSLFLSAHLPIARRYTSKANIYMFVLAWNANYFWTHYFYAVLRATYTFEAHRLNYVPFALYLITHSYFHLYHVLSSMLVRWLWRTQHQRVNVRSIIVVGSVIAVFSWIVAFLEAFTIQNFPYYDIPDRTAMYVYGSMFYALYFIVSFPMFARIDEKSTEWTLFATFVDAQGASMMITQLLDFWRLYVGPIVTANAANAPPPCSVPFIY